MTENTHVAATDACVTHNTDVCYTPHTCMLRVNTLVGYSSATAVTDVDHSTHYTDV